MTTGSRLWRSTRFTLAILAFLAFLNFYALRVNLSFAIVCMVNQTAISHQNQHLDTHSNTTNTNVARSIYNATFINENETHINDDVFNNGSEENAIKKNIVQDETFPQIDIKLYNRNNTHIEESPNKKEGELDWDKEEQGLVHGSFYWGYVLTNVAGGLLADRYGGKHVIGLALLCATLLTFLVPVVARWNIVAFMILRFLTGVAQGFVSPAMQALWSQWAPPLESSRLRSICFAGSQMGKVVTYPLTALLCEYGFDGGWPSVFYVQGLFGIAWYVLWCTFVFDSPAKHPRITELERSYIESSLKGRMATGDRQNSKPPWWKILTSLPVWAIIVAHVACNWGEYTFLTNMPTYFQEVLQYDVKKNGFMSSVPYIFFWLSISLSSWLADVVRKKQLLSTLSTRKLFNSIGQLIPAALVVGVGWAGRDHSELAMSLLTIGIALTGFQYGGGLFLSPGDIAPRYAGVVYGISNTLATLPGFLSPMAIGYLTVDQTQEQWRTVFFISAAIYVCGSIFYNLFASDALQPWAHPEHLGECELTVYNIPAIENKDDEKHSDQIDCQPSLLKEVSERL